MKKRFQVEIHVLRKRIFSEPRMGVEPMTFQIPVGHSNRASNRYLEGHGLDSCWGL